MDWHLKHSQHLIQDDWLSLRSDRCQMPDGTNVEPYYVLEYPLWVNIVALTPQQEVVLVRQYRHGIRQTILELPGGNVSSKDESSLEAAQRELAEETGYHCTQWFKIGRFAVNPASHNNFHDCFLGLGAYVAQAQALDETEDIEVLLKPVAEVFALIDQQEFIHTFHITSLFLAERFLKQRQST